MASIVNRGGRYRALIRREGVTRCKTFGSRREAEAWAARIEASLSEMAATGYVSPQGETVATLIDAYDKAGLIRNAATRSILRVSRRDLGNVKLKDFGLTHLLNWTDKRLSAGNEGVTAAVYVSTLGRVFKWARTAKRVDLPIAVFAEARAAIRMEGHRTKSKPRNRFPTDAELLRLIEAAESRPSQAKLPLADMIRVASITACRRAELCNLKVSDFDPDARTLWVRNRKSPTPDRIDSCIPVFEPAYSVLVRHTTGKKLSDKIFDCSPRSVTRAFTGIARGAGLDDIVFHSLRHRACTKLLSVGLSIPETSLISGHRDWGSLRRYTHLTAQNVATRAKALGLV